MAKFVEELKAKDPRAVESLTMGADRPATITISAHLTISRFHDHDT